MKKLLFTIIAGVALFATNLTETKAQYKNALGLGLEFGNGGTLLGPSFKHAFSSKGMGTAEVLFGNYTTELNAFYDYTAPISGAQGLGWYVGGGVGLGFPEFGDTYFKLIPRAGLDFKIPGAPIQTNFEWRPTGYIGEGSDFEAGRFGFGFRFTF